MENKDFFRTTRIFPEKFQTSTGVGLLRTNKYKQFLLGGDMYYFGVDNDFKDVIAFFNDSQTYFFDLRGEMLFPALSSAEVREQKLFIKMADILERMEKIDLGSYARMLKARIKKQWVQDPSLFETYGRTYIVSAELDALVDNNGNVNFTTYGSDGKRIWIHTRKNHYENTMVSVDFKGPYVSVNVDDETVNAHRYFGGIYYFQAMINFHYLKSVSIRTIKNKKALRGKIHNMKYQISRREFQKLAGHDLEYFDHVAILCNTVTQKPKFEILLMKDEEFQALQINPFSLKIE